MQVYKWSIKPFINIKLSDIYTRYYLLQHFPMLETSQSKPKSCCSVMGSLSMQMNNINTYLQYTAGWQVRL